MTVKTKIPYIPLAERTIRELAEMLGVNVESLGAHDLGAPVGTICTDSRTLKAGDFFLALSGENFDGHDYCARAAEAGARGLIVREDFPSDLNDALPVLRVDDPLEAYGRIAKREREAWGGKVIAISGSVGKTTTRRLVARALSAEVETLEPIKNFNNLIGLPQTLLRLRPEHEVAVLELGMNLPGELRTLAEIARPDVAGLTRIGRAHVGQFESEEELVAAKLELLEASPPGAKLVMNAACENSRRATERFAASHEIVTFAAEASSEADCAVDNVRAIEPVGYRFDLTVPERTYAGLELAYFGKHVLEDVAAAAAFLIAAGYDPALLVDALEGFRSEPMRGEIVRAGEWTFILDCYNAAPEAMVGGLRSLVDLPRASRTVLVLAEMGELGDFAVPAHDALIEPILEIGPGLVVGIGDQMERIFDRLRSEGLDARIYADADALAAALAPMLKAGDRVYFKGSRAYALEKVAAALAPAAFAA